MRTLTHLVVLLIAVSLAPGVSFAQRSDEVGKIQLRIRAALRCRRSSCAALLCCTRFIIRTQKAFQEVAAEDDSCAIAAWGYASILMLNRLAGTGASPKNAEQAQDAIERGARWARRSSASATTLRRWLPTIRISLIVPSASDRWHGPMHTSSSRAIPR